MDFLLHGIRMGKKAMKVFIRMVKKHGKWTEWYENGKKKEQKTYKEGKCKGYYVGWYENGQKSHEGENCGSSNSDKKY